MVVAQKLRTARTQDKRRKSMAAAAARSRLMLPYFGSKNRFIITQYRRRQFARLFTIHNHSDDPSSDAHLLQKLLQLPLSHIKPTLDSQFTSESSDFPWAALLASLSTSAPHKANLVMEWKLEKLTSLNSKSQECYAQLISLCEKIRNLPIALLIFTSMEAQGVAPTTSVFNALVSTSLSSGNFLTALSLFEIMGNSEGCRPDPDTYNAFILAYANMGNKCATKDWVEAKRASGFSVDDVQTYGFLIRCCVKSKNFEDGQRYFDEMLLVGLLPDESVFHDMLLMYCLQKKYLKVKDMLEFLQNGRWRIDQNMIRKVVNLYSELELVKELEEVVVILMESNQSPEVLSIVHCSIIRIHANNDRLVNVEYAVGRMLNQGISFSCAEDVEKVISSYFRMEAYDRLELFLESIKDSYEFSRSIYDLLSTGYERAGLLEKFNMVVTKMKMAGCA